MTRTCTLARLLQWCLVAYTLRPSTGKVTIEVVYQVTCPHCAAFVAQNLVQFMQAKLPGDQVEIVVSPTGIQPGTQAQCNANAMCQYGLAHVCALHSELGYVGADTRSLLNGVSFLGCHLGHTVSGGMSQAVLNQCVASSGLDSTYMNQCISSPSGFKALTDTISRVGTLKVSQKMVGEHFPSPQGLPWVYISGHIVRCEAANCHSIAGAAQDTPLTNPGSLLHLVCLLLDPKPAGCTGVTKLYSNYSFPEPQEGLLLAGPMPTMRSMPVSVAVAAVAFMIGGGVTVAWWRTARAARREHSVSDDLVAALDMELAQIVE